MIAAVIMAGGKGERFWPKSRKKLPKQLLDLTGERKTMIQLTTERIGKIINNENIYVATNNDYVSVISHQLPQIPTCNILVEPMGKNTAACIGLSAIHIAKKDPEAVMIVLASDHLIKDETKFLDIVNSAVDVAKRGDNLVTIGIVPKYPETGYGYINFGEQVKQINSNNRIYKVKRFVEKPDCRTAEKYIQLGNYLWNSGMFVWKVSTILKSIEKHMPDLHQALLEIAKSIDSDDAENILYEVYSKLESVSIDYGIMEKAEKIYVIPGDFGWDDLGSWNSIERIKDRDEHGNIVNGNIISLDTKRCIIEGSNKLIATLGIDNLVIVDTDDVTLICSKDKCQDVKNLLNQIKAERKENYL